MPNYKLSFPSKRQLERDATALTGVYVDCVRQGFPLTHEEVQGCILDADTLRIIKELEARGFEGINTTHSIQLRVTSEELPGLQREAVIGVELAEAVFSASDRHTVYGGTPWGKDCTRVPALLAEHLSAERRVGLTRWCNETIRSRRLKSMADSTIELALMPMHCTGHVLANWPMLATLTRDDMLRRRFQSAPTRLDRYKLDLSPFVKSSRQIQATDTIFNMALMMKPDEATPPARAAVLAYEKLPDDPVFV